eukprot:TRINITY_DN14867_c0_g1_i1.p1 TRINITY_DN14867_c0_g1~~TRINITY_DN14867_c0_g1_i1.p1  ORF type:complete len:517 (+),score=178.48 TRINITY_DN14867_c0_g1_i1:74-1624(+)
MSAIYDHAPTADGKVTLETTLGRVDVELYPKYAPLACRNFLQHCVDQYYEGCIWHRVVPGFCVQTGDPSLLGPSGGQSALKDRAPFKVELSTRLRFKHRGLLAAAAGEDGLNRSQFFITLAEARELDGKHTIFGQVTPETIFPLLQMGQLAVDADNRPLEPPRITRTIVQHNPFDDILARPTAPRPPAEAPAQPAAKRRRKAQGAVRDKALLSCADQWDEIEQGFDAADGVVSTFAKGGRVASAHDVAPDASLLQEESHSAARRKEIRKAHEELDRRAGGADKRTERLKAKVRRAYGRAEDGGSDCGESDSSTEEAAAGRQLSEEALQKIAELKRRQEEVRRAIVAKPGEGGDPAAEGAPKSKGAQLLESMRAQFARRRGGTDREKETTLRVQAYARKVSRAPRTAPERPAPDLAQLRAEAEKPEHVKAEAYASEEAPAGAEWFQGTVEFVNPKAQLAGLAGRADDTYEVVDPLAQGAVLDSATIAAQKRLRAEGHELAQLQHEASRNTATSSTAR